MPHVTVESACRYIAALDLPNPRRATRGGRVAAVVETAFDSSKVQAAVVGSDVISFVSGVTPERRQDIVNSSLLAQLVAKKCVPEPARIYDWYDAYFETLTNLGWALQSKQFAEYHDSGENLEAHQAILQVATLLLGPAPAALAIVKTTLDSLRSMTTNSPWITLFNRETQTARTARFQISLAEQKADGQFLVSLMAFGLEAKATITQVLFFKASKSEATLRHYLGHVTINTDVLSGIRAVLGAKLVHYAQDYVKQLPDF